ncbi:MAG: FixH family protein [Hyphomicrobiaceae bacterium]
MAYLPRALAFVAALSFAAAGASGADRLKVDFTKKSTGHRRGLQYEYTFKVTSAETGEPVPGAEFTVVADMPAMRGHHPTRPAAAAAGDTVGTYRATLHFFMAGEWELKLEFKTPRRDELAILDTVEVGKQAD